MRVFTNIKPCRNSIEEKKSPWSIKVAEEAVRLEWQSLYDSGELNEKNRQYGRPGCGKICQLQAPSTHSSKKHR